MKTNDFLLKTVSVSAGILFSSIILMFTKFGESHLDALFVVTLISFIVCKISGITLLAKRVWKA